MNPRVKDVQANDDFTLDILFTNDEIRRFDVKPYLDKGIFQQLKDIQAFKRVKPFMGSIKWDGGQDLCPDTKSENHNCPASLISRPYPPHWCMLPDCSA